MVAERPTRPSGSDQPNSPDRPDDAEGLVGGGFAVVRRGYDPDAVEAYLRRLDAQVQIMAADRDAAVEQSRQMGVELEACRGRVERMRGQVSALSGPEQSVATTSERVRSMLRLVEDDILELPSRVVAQGPDHVGDGDARRLVGILVGVCAESMRAAARAAAAAVEAERDRLVAELATARREDAARNTAAMAAVEAERGRVLAELETARRVNAEQIKQATAAAEAERARAWADAQARCARAWADAQARCAQAWADSQARCAQVERDFRLALDSRRSEAIALLASEREQTRRMNEELRAAAVQEAHRTMEDARTKTQQILEQGERRMTLLRGQREQLIARLDAAHQDLHRALSGLLPPSEPTSSD